MNALHTLLLVLVLAFPAQEKPLVERYHAHAAAGELAALAEVWSEHPGEALMTIDADLEGSLAAIEAARAAGKEPDAKAIEAQRGRARFGAQAADLAFGTEIFSDYAVAFASFSDADAARFRAGQAAFGRARAAAAAGDHAAMLAAASECESAARPLGDWWGAAMGAAARGQALVALGRVEEALAPLAEAALIYHDLRLLPSEYQTLCSLADALAAAGKAARAEQALARAIALGEALGDAQGVEALRAKLAKAR